LVFDPTPLPGVVVVRPERHVDGRGYFARTWAPDEMESNGLSSRVAQCSTSYNEKAGTLRGLHYQRPPYAEAKLVRCVRGRVFDVALDIRPGSRTFGRWIAAELDAAGGAALYIPEGFAHGYITLEDHSEVFYMISAPYTPAAAGGVRWDDPLFAIEWPRAPAVINERDATYPDFTP
jgi:dTDP-4-dehydrorhamnose 3,5-epimerase